MFSWQIHFQLVRDYRNFESEFATYTLNLKLVTQSPKPGTRNPYLRLLHDVGLQSADDLEDFGLLRRGHFEFV
ncbi:MAG: hypothetical protein QOJ64_951 [Acidobacteriota bacterium]|jgi:hypothetical protein|nr:hypothetical protein [Acidobacteriota bacterium]